MVFWAFVLFVFGIALLIDSYNPLFEGFLRPVSSILIMLISIGILYRAARLSRDKNRRED